MQEKTKGIVLRAIKYSDTSLIVRIYTRKKGMLTFMLKGVRSSKSKLRPSLFQPLYLLDLDIYFNRGKSLQKIREVRPFPVLQKIPLSFSHSSIAIFLSEIIQKSIREEEENEQMFDFIYQFVCLLDSREKDTAIFPLFFLLRFSFFLGFLPRGNFTDNTPYFDLVEGNFISSRNEDCLQKKASFNLYQLLKSNFLDFDKINLPREERNTLLESLIRYYKIHIDSLGEIKSYLILRSVMDQD